MSIEDMDNMEEEIRDICESHLAYLLDKEFTCLVRARDNDIFELTLTKPWATKYDHFKLSDVDCELYPLHILLSTRFDVKEINLWTINEKYIISRDVASSLIEFNQDSNFMEIGISYINNNTSDINI